MDELAEDMPNASVARQETIADEELDGDDDIPGLDDGML